MNTGQPEGASTIEVSHPRRRFMRWWVIVLAFLALGSMAARAACGTNLNAVIDLSTWSVVQYDVFSQSNATWTLSENNTVALQSVNADASILLSPFMLQNERIQGSWQVNTNEDDDFMGFVFGYQDDHHFYLFDWKEFNQFNTTWGASLQGMSVKVINADTPLTGVDLGTTVPVDTNRVRLLYHNDISWAHFTNYDFSIELRPGHFTIKVTEGTNVLDTIVIDDATYASGQFGFYNFSQSMVRYAGFTRSQLSPRPVISVEDSSVREGDAGTTDMVFSVSLSFSNCEPVLVDYFITPGTATAVMDYTTPGFGTLVFAPGETNKLIPVSVIGDTLDEEDETLFITLSNAVGGDLGHAHAVGTIIDDDPFPILSVEDVSIREGDSGFTVAAFSLKLSAPSAKAIRVGYSTTDGTAVADGDYAAVSPAVRIVFPGQTSTLIEVPVFGDTDIELDETFFLCLTNAVNVTLANLRAVCTILNDDGNHPCDPALSATPLVNQTRCLCDEVEFSTTVSSPEPASFVWKANGVVLPGQTNRTLLLQSLKPAQAGTYTVEVSTACAATSRSATLTLRGAGDQNPASFTNAAPISIPLSGLASPYPSAIVVECVPGLVKHIAVTLDGLSHSSPDDVDILLVGPGGRTLKLMSDSGGFSSQKITNVLLTFSDTATTPLPDATRISSGLYRPTNYGDVDAFTLPAPTNAPAADFAPFLASDPNGLWSLFVVDDQGGDSGTLLRGWSLTIEWEDSAPWLTSPLLLADGRFQTTLHGLPHMTHVIEASSDLAHWIPISTNTLAAPAVIILDPRPDGESHRFYRAIRCP